MSFATPAFFLVSNLTLVVSVNICVFSDPYRLHLSSISYVRHLEDARRAKHTLNQRKLRCDADAIISHR